MTFELTILFALFRSDRESDSEAEDIEHAEKLRQVKAVLEEVVVYKVILFLKVLGRNTTLCQGYLATQILSLLLHNYTGTMQHFTRSLLVDDKAFPNFYCPFQF